MGDTPLRTKVAHLPLEIAMATKDLPKAPDTRLNQEEEKLDEMLNKAFRELIEEGVISRASEAKPRPKAR